MDVYTGGIFTLKKEHPSMMTRILFISAMLSFSTLALAQSSARPMQTHQHGAPTASVDGRYNPYIVSDDSGGFYLAYVERAGGASDVMLSHSSDGVNFPAPVRVNDLAGDATVRNENPPKVAAGAQGEVYV